MRDKIVFGLLGLILLGVLVYIAYLLYESIQYLSSIGEPTTIVSLIVLQAILIILLTIILLKIVALITYLLS